MRELVVPVIGIYEIIQHNKENSRQQSHFRTYRKVEDCKGDLEVWAAREGKQQEGKVE